MGILGDAFDKVFGSGESEQKTTSTPWGPLQPYLTDAYAQAQNLYRSGGPEYYPNATYVPFSPQTQMGMQLGENRALFGSPYDEAAGGFAMNALQGQSPFTQAGMQSLWGSQLGMAGLSDTIQGKFLNSNPYLDNMFGAAARATNTQYNNQVMPGVNATFGSGGRTGSNAHQTALDMANQNYNNSMSDMAANLYGTNYANERNNQLNAANQYANLGQSLAQGYNALGNTQFGQQMNAANLGMNVGQQDWNNIDRLLGIGGMVEGQSQNVLNDYMNRFNFYQNRPETQMNNYTAWLNGIPGSQFGTDKTSGSGPDAGAFGDLTTAAQGIGAVMSIFSDARLKRNVRRVGEHNGFGWYQWEWNDDAAALGLSGASEGVIAQEVEATRPDLVHMVGGYKAVNYGGL